ncbi:MAG: tRNA (adenosine(37)-N6)-threonylcarbamoyltransferase complex dimerization subunit type 1 TsaB [Caulobacteraceae bacterium]|nr:tRNA (adenosine(37)-N6)-threonylcarbamoyltransferase complex dimerization subunit type 1 TsaB [Caulobacteraceae bacterium]
MVLALDTCLTACSAAVVADGAVRAARSEPMARGHQERLAVLVREILAEAGVAPAALDRVGVTIGPGSFTGLRVGLAFAKGLGAALGRPVIGVGVLEALAFEIKRPAAAVIDARRDQVYLQTFAWTISTPVAASPDAARAAIAALGEGVTLVGPGAGLFNDLPAAHIAPRDAADPVAVARIAASRPPAPLKPLYLRAPDARLPSP